MSLAIQRRRLYETTGRVLKNEFGIRNQEGENFSENTAFIQTATTIFLISLGSTTSEPKSNPV